MLSTSPDFFSAMVCSKWKSVQLESAPAVAEPPGMVHPLGISTHCNVLGNSASTMILGQVIQLCCHWNLGCISMFCLIYAFIYICHLLIYSCIIYVHFTCIQPMVSSWTRFVEEPALGNTLSIGWMLGRSKSKVLGYKLNQQAIPLTDAATTLWMKERRRLKALHHTCLEKMILWKKIKAQWTWYEYHIKLV